MNDKLYSLFDKFAPSQSDDELLLAVLRKAENNMEKKKSYKKLLLIPAAAALALSVGAVGVGAACDWDFEEAFRAFFSGGSSAVQEVGSGFDFTKSGKPLGVSLSAEHCTIIANGIVADSGNLYLLYDVVFDEGFDCSTGIAADWSNWLFNTTLSVNGEVVGIAEDMPLNGGFNLAQINGNTYTACASWGGGSVSLSENDVIEIGFVGMERYGYSAENLDKTERVEFSGVSVETVLDFDLTADSRTLELNQPVSLRGQSAVLNSLTVTPFNISWQATYNDLQEAFEGENSSAIEISYTDIAGKTAVIDGSVMTSGSYYTNIENGTAEWNYPVNIGDIASVTIGGTVIELT